jgi:hypothetical protein
MISQLGFCFDVVLWTQSVGYHLSAIHLLCVINWITCQVFGNIWDEGNCCLEWCNGDTQKRQCNIIQIIKNYWEEIREQHGSDVEDQQKQVRNRLI